MTEKNASGWKSAKSADEEKLHIHLGGNGSPPFIKKANGTGNHLPQGLTLASPAG